MAGLSPYRIEKHENRQTPKSFLRSSEEDSVVSTEFGRNFYE
jgi:hypothetical protein